MSNTVQPIFILPEGSNRNTGRDAQRNNISAAIAVAETVRTTLGPKGMDKMLVDALGDIIITNDGVTILEEMQVNHPAAKMLVEVSKTQEQEVGDGTTTAVVLAGELLKKADELLDQNIHPTVLTNGYRIASLKAMEILQSFAESVKVNDKKMLEKVAITAMTGKSAEIAREKLADMIVEAIGTITETNGNDIFIDREALKIEKRTGGSVDDSELIKGIVIDKERVHADMPRKVDDAKVLLLDAALEVKETEKDTQIRITRPEELQAFLEQEERMLHSMVKNVIESGANVVFCEKGIDDTVQHLLARKKIYACRRVKKSDMEKLSKATGAKIVNEVDEITKEDIGFAGLVEQKKIGGEEMTFVEKCKHPKSVTLLIRGGTEHVIDEIERAIVDSIGDIISVIKDNGRIVAGGGSAEIEVSKQLNNYSDTLKGREQLAVKAFAQALEVIPRTLAENAGIDPIDILVALKAKHELKDGYDFGLSVFDGAVKNMKELGVIEPLRTKVQAINSATEAAIMILRIDDVIASGKDRSPQMPPGGMPPGMGGMQGMGM
ncbi:MAG: TCP-1/cpn60 chaperonin family protein [Nanoarchaeota archaeon]|nr:TCP-1/cpn60 chaperonin family protein [Nanoarchaeota archaeon]